MTISDRLAGIFRSLIPPRRNRYQHLIDQSLAASRARFHTWEFEPGTMTLDPNAASLDEIEAALSDCRSCRAVEYPETAEGYERACTREEELLAALRRRFPDHHDLVVKRISEEAVRAARSAYGPY